MDRKKILAIVRDRPEYVELLERLYNSGKFDLVVETELSNKLANKNILCENFHDFDNDKVKYWVEKTSLKIKKKLPEIFRQKSFQNIFSIDNNSFFNSFAEDLCDHLYNQFIEEIIYIEVFENLIKNNDIALVLVWTDVQFKEKTLTRAAQAKDIPVLQLLHGGIQGYGHDHMERKIYADKKMANLSPVSKDVFSFYGVDDSKMEVTGRIEFDKVSCSSIDHINELTSDKKDRLIVFGTTSAFPQGALYFNRLKSLETANHSFMEAFCDLRKKHDDLRLLIKVHPGFTQPHTPEYFQELTNKFNINDAIITTENLKEALTACDLLVSFKSTICIDAVLLDKPVVILDFLDQSDHLFYKDQAFSYVRKSEDVKATLENALFDEDFRDELAKKREKSKYYLNYLNDGKAMDRIIDVINELVK